MRSGSNFANKQEAPDDWDAETPVLIIHATGTDRCIFQEWDKARKCSKK
jgi:hypothetical protein